MSAGSLKIGALWGKQHIPWPGLLYYGSNSQKLQERFNYVVLTFWAHSGASITEGLSGGLGFQIHMIVRKPLPVEVDRPLSRIHARPSCVEQEIKELCVLSKIKYIERQRS